MITKITKQLKSNNCSQLKQSKSFYKIWLTFLIASFSVCNSSISANDFFFFSTQENFNTFTYKKVNFENKGNCGVDIYTTNKWGNYVIVKNLQAKQNWVSPTYYAVKYKVVDQGNKNFNTTKYLKDFVIGHNSWTTYKLQPNYCKSNPNPNPPQSSCNSISVNAGKDVTICSGQNIDLSASVSGADKCSSATEEDCNHKVFSTNGYESHKFPHSNAAVCGDNKGAKLWTKSGDGVSFVTLDFGKEVPAGTEVIVRMKLEHCSNVSSETSSHAKVEASKNGWDNYEVLAQNVPFSNNFYKDFKYNLKESARYVRVVDNGGCAILVDYVKYSTKGSNDNNISYAWNGPGIVGENNKKDITVSQPGIYTVKTTTCRNCTKTDSVEVFSKNLTIKINGDDKICSSETTKLSVATQGEVLWSNGATTNTIEVSPTETTKYSVVVKENGCEATDEITVNVNSTSLDLGDDKTIDLGETVELTAPDADTYEWSTDETTQTISVSPNSTTTYTLTITKNGCKATDEITVNVTDLEVTISGSSTICTGESTKLTASILDADSYEWSTGETTAMITISPKATTTYTLSTTKNSVTATAEVIVTVNATTLDLGADKTVCSGTPTTLTAPNAETYLWSTGETTQSIIVSPTENTTYSLTINNDGCDATDEIAVNVNSLGLDLGEDQTICAGKNTKILAPEADEYLWSTGETTQFIVVEPTETTTYSLTITQNACKSTDEIVVNVKSILVDLGEDLTIDVGQSATLTSSDLEADSYLWSTGETTSSITVSPASTRTYELTIEKNGCITKDTVIVNVTLSPLSVSISGNDQKTCSGETVTLTSSVTDADSYLWSTGETSSSVNVSPEKATDYSLTITKDGLTAKAETTVDVNSFDFNFTSGKVICNGESVVLEAPAEGDYLWSTGETTKTISVDPSKRTIYSLTITNDGCSVTKQIKVDVIDSKVDLGPDKTVCPGESVLLTGPGSGGTFLWSTGETTQSIRVTPTELTTYSLSVEKGNCESFDEVAIDVSPFDFDFAFDSGKVICPEDTVELTAPVDGTGYLWSTGETTKTISVKPTETTIYSLTINRDGCAATKQIKVAVVPPKVDLGPDRAILSGETIVFTAAKADSYLWSTGETTQSITVSPTETTTYSVITKQGRCSAFDQVVISVGNSTPIDLGADKTICLGDSVTLTGPQAEFYNWSNGAKTQSITISPSKDTEYSLTISNGRFRNTDTIKITVESVEDVSVSDGVTINEGESTNITADGGDSYLWLDDNSTSALRTVNPTETTTYTVKITKGNCSVDKTVTVTVTPSVDPCLKLRYNVVAFPNPVPFRGNLNVNIQLQNPEKVTYHICALDGKVIGPKRTKDFDKGCNEFGLDLSTYGNFAAGTFYFVVIEGTDWIRTYKLLMN